MPFWLKLGFPTLTKTALFWFTIGILGFLLGFTQFAIFPKASHLAVRPSVVSLKNNFRFDKINSLPPNPILNLANQTQKALDQAPLSGTQLQKLHQPTRPIHQNFDHQASS